MTENMRRLMAVALALPEAARVDIEAWDGEPTFRVRGKNFVFTDPEANHLTVKLPKDEAAAVVASEPGAEPAGYGLGRHGWVRLTITPDEPEDRWDQLAEWVRVSYTLVAPKTLARLVDPAG
ncbi:MmcQ/YjbR family DNA-binding protein [Frankia sp. CNm7]|uniref:MmcQ/YjbR family DNA-binding protein n=1 Tax=Frankia nepalensis TaxID=1836974 RepID=A0A937UP30_9ACTN|nr:MmcQ/YjbR family DNA-binding protein [Frankia nepalensis]MBL7496161.1 MmcQ/YjbR family DNA-binding protein [Frankia nepalensis]MBL7508901.1 MmcQ/YjbR family DNA-binding protein [Frankia nepalensis]MBL7516740.1 MmcQ/YjbR family DNA-binding protein [Frankia nepalensis]MBL7628678.1 MmcQ/YjbR family DNA-binding protein [Frankia nepalensis]